MQSSKYRSVIFLLLGIGLLSAGVGISPRQTFAATHTDTFTTAGANSWTAPVGVTSVIAECWGTGGSGGGSTSATRGGSGGGGGAYAKTASVAVTPGNSYTASIGALGSTGTGAGGAGGDTSFTGDSTQKCLAKGGGGGGTNGGTAGAGGLASASTGDVGAKFDGGSGFATVTTVGGGGGGNSSTGNGTSATGQSGAAGGGSSSPGGDGGNIGVDGTAPISGFGGGGGGSGCRIKSGSCSAAGGSTSHSGGAGFLGKVQVTYTIYTVLADTTDPGNTTLNPGDSATMADAFTFQTSFSTDTVTAAVVDLGSGGHNGISLVEITNSAGTTVYGSVSNPSSDTPSITLSTNTLTANTTLTTYKIRITPKSSVTGGPYTVTAKISSYTSTNTSSGSDTAGTTITINNDPSAPTVTTSAASSITKTTATLNGNITATGGASATVRGFAYGTASNLSSVIATTTESGTFGTGAFTASISSLTCNTTYYVRAYATNSAGTGYGSIQSFLTSACAPTVTTTNPVGTSITTTTATLNGNITATGGANATVRGFAYGTASDLSSVIATTTESGSFSTGAFTAAISSLTCGTTYYARAYATNTGGDGFGSIQTFSTSACGPTAPSVTTNSASSVTNQTATLNGNITATGGSNATVRGFAYGTASNLSSVIATTTESGSFSTGTFTYGATSLTCNTTYYFRAYATNSTGTGYGTILNFTSSACVKPTVSTDAASNVSITTATLNGTVSDTGGTTVTTRGFAYSTNSALTGGGVSTTTDSGSYGTGSFTFGATGLTCGVTYYNRAYATNSAGTGYGSIGNFTTSCVDTTPNRSMRLFEGFRIKFVSGKLIINQKQ